jgi:hypothetical protein
MYLQHFALMIYLNLSGELPAHKLDERPALGRINVNVLCL